MKIFAYLSGVVAVISVILAVIARLFFVNKAILGLSALAYLRVSNTMLLFAIAFLVLEYVNRK